MRTKILVGKPPENRPSRKPIWEVNTNMHVREIVLVKAIALMMAAVSTSETSINFYQTTRRNVPEDSHLHTCRCENLQSHKA
jgi:hypothetical protein